MHEIIDFHTHAFPDKLAPRALTHLKAQSKISKVDAYTDGTVNGLRQSMADAGINRSVICSIATNEAQFIPILTWSASAASPHFIPFASIHPESHNVVEQIKKVKEAGFKGIKIHPQHQDFDILSDSVQSFFIEMNKTDLILVTHCGLDFAFGDRDYRAAVWKIRELHAAYPGIRLIATHMGGWMQWEQSLDMLAGTDVYFDTSFSVGFADDDLMLEFFRKHPTDRIVFGSDSPWTSQSESLSSVKKLLSLQHDRELLDMIFSGNARKLLSI